MSNVTFTKTANALDKIIGSSSRIKPYQTHSESPVIKTRIITKERSSTFLSRITFINCGIIATDVSAPATIPNTFSSIQTCEVSVKENFNDVYCLYDDILHFLVWLRNDSTHFHHADLSEEEYFYDAVFLHVKVSRF